MDETEECVDCHKHHDQMLMLTCVHDPCINCALQHYIQQSNGKVRYNVYTCEICGEITPLDISSVVELERMIPAFKRLPVQIINKTKRQQPMTHSSPVIPKQDVFIAPKYTHVAIHPTHSQQANEQIDLLRQIETTANPIPIRHSVPIVPRQLPIGGPTSRRNGCRQHEEEEITYYCFTCLANICPQCAIHGSHQGHSVKQIKKAIGEIKSQFLNVVDQVQRVSSVYKAQKDHFTKSLSNFGELHTRHRKSVTEFFQLIRREIAKKQAQLLTKLDQVHQNNLRLIHNKIEVFNQEKESADKLAATVLNVLKKDELTILQEYGHRAEQFKDKLDKYDMEPPEQKIDGLKTVNNNQLRDFTSEIANLISRLNFQWTNLQENQIHIREILGDT